MVPEILQERVNKVQPPLSSTLLLFLQTLPCELVKDHPCGRTFSLGFKAALPQVAIRRHIPNKCLGNHTLHVFMREGMGDQPKRRLCRDPSPPVFRKHSIVNLNATLGTRKTFIACCAKEDGIDGPTADFRI